MPSAEQVIAVVREWIYKAENDLTTAVHTLRLGADCPTDTVCFHSQQCVEKYLKGLRVSKGIDFPKTHDISELKSLLPKSARPKLTAEEERRLTGYATDTRYPNGSASISIGEARLAVRTARRVRTEVRGRLPSAALEKP